MAPRKTATSDKAPKAAVTKKTTDKVIKRPARGYHKFRNGLLNVTPKGGEKELARQNQNSSLLRLPAEVRNQIWKLVLGAKVYWARYTKKFQLSPTEPKNAMALLRTCRQIYAETALMPLTLSTFACASVTQAKGSLGKLKPHQRKQITSLQFLCPGPISIRMLQEGYFKTYNFVLARSLPNLQELRVRIFSAGAVSSTRETVEDEARDYLRPSLQGMSVVLKVDQTEELWSDYTQS
ncbi:hypothetical protein BKA58DRAFT_466490 [Alternaria rosae]|uniref:uncharacterized protein n=1 Tax=Alternaria rosae TaxID=1187941 RepID=UPI001E8E235A|nr:uncharacterized protein BKA58DRAFT_466490 [Alternaria rosae]KAH6878871.1 hypothetical protein BKA58DRAFT_466490 [Alternaria rosae]